jgi:hypothetical protein
MSIGKRVTEAFEKMLSDDPEGALFAICAAIEETARRERRQKGRHGYKALIADNIHLVTGFGLGHPIASLRMGYSHPNLPTDDDGNAQIEDIVYHVMRCGLYHTAALPASVIFTNNRIGGNGKGDLLLPKSMVSGLIVFVVCSPANTGETTDPSFCVTAFGRNFFLNRIWGKRVEVTAMVLKLAEQQDAARIRPGGDPPLSP